MPHWSRTDATRIDAETGIIYLVDEGETDERENVWVGPKKQGVVVMDDGRNRAGVSDAGALYVAPKGGTPQTGVYDAAGADTYTTIMTAAKQCHFMCIHVKTNGVQISLDGGVTNGPAISSGLTTTGGVLSGLDIPAGAVIKARNAVAGSNYANLIVTIW
jgi:hypothetical protein